MKKNAFYYDIKKNEEFQATVLFTCEAKLPLLEKDEVCYIAILDREGFYPEGGGQESDRGYIGDSHILSVQEFSMLDRKYIPKALLAYIERLGIDYTKDISEIEAKLPILHYIREPLIEGTQYHCKLDWEWRNINSQNHTGEHIISGLVHSRFSYENIGFHMSLESARPVMTIDFDGEIGWGALLEIEREANRIVRENIAVSIYYPDALERSHIPYRSKKELKGDVRLVEIADVDNCACCGTHVLHTGEVGMIKILSLTRHRGGSRIEMICGDLALRDYEERYEVTRELTHLLSVPLESITQAVSHQSEELKEKDYRIVGLNTRYFESKAELYRLKFAYNSLKAELKKGNENPEGTVGDPKIIFEFLEGFRNIEARKYCDYLLNHVEADLIAIFLKEKGKDAYSYVIASQRIDVRELGKELKQKLSARGGGQSSMIQGSLQADSQVVEKVIKEFMLSLGL